MDRYREKRDFDRTPEPVPGTTGRRGALPVFVVHRHEARRLHYDLRLEMEGVLKSWAVPKGFSFDPSEKRLAVRTEDHPIEYEDFHGVIPKGQYGAGTMMIWDRGPYELLGSAAGPACIEAGKIELRLFGGRLRGEWHMVELKQKGQWLMFKARDRYARSRDEPIPALDLVDRPRSKFPRRHPPMRPADSSPPFYDPDWLFEVEFAGRRVQVHVVDDRIRLVDRRGKELAARFPEIVNALAAIRARRAVMDGVLVSLDEHHRPSRERLDERIRGGGSSPASLYVFDLMYFEDWDVRPFPLVERKATLRSLVPESPAVHYLDHERGRAEQLIEMVRAVGLPGVVAKRAASPYRSGPSPDWRAIAGDVPEAGAPADLFEALASAQDAMSRRGDPRVKITNPTKILWPQDGYTKRDLIDYYDQVSDYLIPYLKDRPLSLNRFPNGIEADSFYQKDTPDHLPDWIETIRVESSNEQGHVRFILCNDRATLLYLANLASIDLHPWLSCRDRLDSPDWAVLDLDPSSASFEDVVTIARTLGKMLRGVGLRPCVKTSGAKGIHIYVPLRPGYSYEQSRMFCEALALLVVREHPKIATVERVKSRRAGKVYVDYLQNRQGQTVVPPYAVRPVAGASVSTPLDWDELQSGLHPSQFTIHTVPGRLSRVGDLFQPTLIDPQDLLPAIDAIDRMIREV